MHNIREHIVMACVYAIGGIIMARFVWDWMAKDMPSKNGQRQLVVTASVFLMLKILFLDFAYAQWAALGVGALVFLGYRICPYFNSRPLLDDEVDQTRGTFGVGLIMIYLAMDMAGF